MREINPDISIFYLKESYISFIKLSISLSPSLFDKLALEKNFSNWCWLSPTAIFFSFVDLLTFYNTSPAVRSNVII
jgi:hypothetical protein